jgi:hypothetical protein
MADETITSVRMTYMAMSAAAAAKIGLSAIFNASVNVSDMALFCDVMATTDFVQILPAGGAGQVVVRHGIGVRVALMAVNVKADVSLDLPSVAASAALEGTELQYEVQALGLPASVQAAIIAAAPSTGPLTPQAFAGLQQVLTDLLPKYLKTVPTTAPSTSFSPYSVGQININMDRLVRAGLINKAMQAIAGGNSLRAALGMTGADPDVTRLVYAEMAGLTDGTADSLPATDKQQAANLWLSGN